MRDSSAGKALKKTIDDQDAAIKKQSASIGEHQRNVGNYGQVWNGAVKAFGYATAAIALVGGALKTMGKIIESSDTLFDKWTETIQAAKGATNAFFVTIANGDWKNLTQNMHDAIDAGIEYAKQMDIVDDKTAGLNAIDAKRRLEISKLIVIARDVTKSEKERVKAAEEALKIEQDILYDRMQIAKQTYDAQAVLMSKLEGLKVGRYEVVGLLTGENVNPEKLKIIMDRTSEAERKALLESYAKLYDTQRESLEGTRRLRATHAGLVKEILKKENSDLKSNVDEKAKLEEEQQNDLLKQQQNIIEAEEFTKKTRQESFTNTIESLKLDEEAQIIYAERTIKNKDELEKEKLRIHLNSLADQLAATRLFYEADGELTDEEINKLRSLEQAIAKIQNQINTGVSTGKNKTIWDLIGLNEEEAKKADILLNSAMDSISKVAAIRSKSRANDIQEEDAAYNKERERIENSRINQVQKTKQLEQLDKQHRQKQYELDLKQWQTNQDWAYGQAVIYTALAAIKAYVDGSGSVDSWLNVAGALVAGGLQIAAISQEQPPEPPGYALGGKPPLTGNQGTLIRVNEGKKQEMIMNPGATALFGDKLTQMNQIGRSSIPSVSGMSAGDAVLTDSIQSQRLESAISQMEFYLGYKEFDEFNRKMIRYSERSRA